MHQTDRRPLGEEVSKGTSGKSILGLVIISGGWLSVPLLCWYLEMTTSGSPSIAAQAEVHAALQFAACSLAFYTGLIASGWWHHDAKVQRSSKLVSWCGLGLLAFISSLLAVSSDIKLYLMLLLLPAFAWCLLIEKRAAFSFNPADHSQTNSSVRSFAGSLRFLTSAICIFISGFIYLESEKWQQDQPISAFPHQQASSSNSGHPSISISTSTSDTTNGSSNKAPASEEEESGLAIIKSKARLATLAVRNHRVGIRGSGCWITLQNGQTRALTAAHIVEGSTLAEVEWRAPSEKLTRRSEARVEMIDTSCDLALLQIMDDLKTDPPVTLELAAGSPMNESLAFAMSYREAPQRLRVRQKTIRRPKEREIHLMWEADLPGIAGESGGPLVASAGLIGIRSGTSNEFSYFTHLELLREFLGHPSSDR